jgi:hypothetical protein
MVLLIGTILGLFVAWRVQHLGLYVALCDVLGLTLATVAGMAFAGHVAALVPLEHPLKGAGCILLIVVVGWVAFRTIARSFAGDWAVEFGYALDRFGAMAVAFGGTMIFTSLVSVLFLATGPYLDKIRFLEEPFRQAASIALTACDVAAWFAGGQAPFSLDLVLRAAG